MNDQTQKPRGPLLWLTDCVRQRPIVTITVALLLLMLAGVSTIGITMIMRQQRALEQQLRAELELRMIQQQDAELSRQKAMEALRELEQQLSTKSTPASNSQEPRTPDAPEK